MTLKLFVASLTENPALSMAMKLSQNDTTVHHQQIQK